MKPWVPPPGKIHPHQTGPGAPEEQRVKKKAAPTFCRGREGRYRVLTYATSCFTDSFLKM
jgi:hypothetical protein